MTQRFNTRRRFVFWPPAALVASQYSTTSAAETMTVYTFGDSILDCGHYNQYGVHPGQLIVKNSDNLFPEFRGNDLSSRGPARLEHRAQDGATVRGLPSQASNLKADGQGAAIITVGGNDLLQGLVVDSRQGIQAFAEAL